MIGDEGSGYWIGREALAAVMRAADGRGPATALSDDVLGALQRRRRVAAAAHRLRPRAAAGRASRRSGRSCSARPPTGRRRRDADPRARRRRARARRRARSRRASRCAATRSPVYLAGGIFRVVPWLAEELPRAADRGRAALPACSCSTRSRRSAPSGWRSPKREAARKCRIPAIIRKAAAAPFSGSMTDTGFGRLSRHHTHAHPCFFDTRGRSRARWPRISRGRSDASQRSSSGCRPGARRFRSIASWCACSQRGARRFLARDHVQSRRVPRDLAAQIRAATARSCSATCSRSRQPVRRADPVL